MSDDVKINTIKDGKLLFVYSDKFNIFFFILAKENEEDILYKITTDKYYTVLNFDEIEHDVVFDDAEDIIFHKPLNNNNGDYKFIGRIDYGEGVIHKFTIDTDLVLVEEKDTASTSINTEVELLKCLDNIKVKRFIQKGSKIYLIGYEGEKKIPLYAIADIERDELDKVYFLYTDTGDVVVNTISIDYSDLRVYVGGYIQEDETEEEGNPAMFFESFLFL